MNNSTKKNGLLIAVGAAIGAAAGYYFNSDKGRELRKESKEKASEWSNQATQSAQEVVDSSKQSAKELLKKSEELADRLRAAKREFMEYNNTN